MTIVRVTDDSTAEDVREAITHLAAKASRLPAHWVDRKADIHREIDRLLDMLERMPATSVAAGRVGV